MEWFALVITFLVSCSTLVGLLKWREWRRVVAIMDHLPGPRTIPIIGNILIFLVNREELLPLSTRLHKEFGLTFRVRVFNINVFVTAQADYVEALLSNTQEIKKGMAYKCLEPWLGTGLLTSSGAKWFSHRKLLTPSFHFSILEKFITTFNEKSKLLENKLREIPPGTEFNMYPYITLCSLDIICEAVMGVDMNCQEKNQSAYISAVHDISEAIVKRMFRPWQYYGWIFYKLTSEGETFSKSLKLLHHYSNKVVKEKRAASGLKTLQQAGSVKDPKKKRSFLDLLLQASEKQQVLSHEEVREEVDTFMFEGHDTTTAAICWTLFLLGNHTQIQDKVVEEMDSIFQGEDRNMTSTDLKEMKYLERVIKETMRLYPSVPFFDRTLKNDIKLGEYLIPGGVQIRIAAYIMHRSAEYFDNPNTFNPDNFLPEKVRTRHPFSYIPFSAGPRNCIGQKFAMMELKAVLARIFLNFRIESMERIEDVTPMADLILRPKSGLKVKLYPRSRKN